MKKLFFLLFLAVPACFFAQTKEVEIIAKVFGCQPTDSLKLFESEGLTMTPLIAAAKSGPDSAYHLHLPMSSNPKFYFFGLSEQMGRYFLLGKEPIVTIWAGCANVDKARTVGSQPNADYDVMMKTLTANKEESSALLQKARACGDETCQKAAMADLAKLDKKKKTYLDSLRKSNPVLARVAALNTYMNSDATQSKALYKQERDFFAKEFFKNADLTDAAYNDIPDLFGAFRIYSNSLVNFGFDDAAVKTEIEGQLSKIPSASKAYKYALGGTVSGLAATPKLAVCEAYLNQFGDKYNMRNSPTIGRIRYTINQAKSSMLGIEAPDFTMNTAEDKPLSLKELRGNIVLVDFWASWCGPCRKENPNVVAAFQKYKDKGFNVLGVSLDSNKDRWMDAIKADNLTWTHVSDLKGWQNEAAKLYSVSSIPQNVLLDKQGNILARNLRGDQLEQKLAEVFGN